MRPCSIILFFLISVSMTSCGNGGNVENIDEPSSQPSTPTPAPVPTPITQNLFIPPKQFLGGENLISGSGGGQTYNMSIGLNHYVNTTISNGNYNIVIGHPKQVISP